MATKDHVRGGQDADGTRLRELSVSVRLDDGTVTERLLRRGLLVGDDRRSRHLREQA